MLKKLNFISKNWIYNAKRIDTATKKALLSKSSALKHFI
ncbi:hypothetical protein CU016_0045 [Enterococcus lactis]|nr:hypothetical protein [Enterococcus lactis]MBL5013286.1 hypothetical protein [Enterococcus lactis]